jgi:hypothetical protein
MTKSSLTRVFVFPISKVFPDEYLYVCVRACVRARAKYNQHNDITDSWGLNFQTKQKTALY